MLHIKNLSVSVNSKFLLNNLNLSVAQGAVHVLMGPNGSGKSTLANTIMGHSGYQVGEGSIKFNNNYIHELPCEKRARLGLFLASQQIPEIPGVNVFTFLKEVYRVLTNQDISVSDFKNLVLDVFEHVKLSAAFMHRNLHENFSGGEKKRFEIAQLLLFKPKLVILDEIDSGLDVDAIKHVGQALAQVKFMNPQITFLIITHYNRLREYMPIDTVSVLNNGAIQTSGNNLLITHIENEGYHEPFF